MNDLYKKLIFSQEEFKGQLEFWQERLAGELQQVNLPYDEQRTANRVTAAESVEFALSADLSSRLLNLSKNADLTLYIVLLAGWKSFLHRYCDSEEITVASPLMKREGGANQFNHLVLLRDQINADATFKDILMQVKATTLEGYKHQDYPLDLILESLGLGSEVIKIIFALENIHDLTELSNLQPDLYVRFIRDNTEIKGVVNYPQDVFKRSTVQRLIDGYLNFLQAVISDVNRKLDDVEVLTLEEREWLVHTQNATTAEYPAEETVHQIFAKQVAMHPDRVALEAEWGHLTYGDVNHRANQLAHLLRTKGVGRQSIVAMLTERSFEMVIGILAILKAGGAYLPIDRNYPVERIEYILADSKAVVILTTGAFPEGLHFTGEVLDLRALGVASVPFEVPIEPSNVSCSTEKLSGNDAVKALSLQEGDEIANLNDPTDLAYVLYTSGSTGRPKGVMVEHRSLVNTISHLQRKYPLGETDAILQSTVYTFDASVRELFWWFFAGARLTMLAPDEEKYPVRIIETIARYKVTMAKFVPLLANEILTVANEGRKEQLQSLKYFLVGGEALARQLVDNFFTLFGREKHPMLLNVYGPTETTIHCTEFEVTAPIAGAYAPLGQPISNMHIYLLDRKMRPLPAGVPGELYIGGVGVARAFLNNPELTAERFILNPFVSGERLYKSGDLGRWSTDGQLEFLGRIDHQVKIRGFRIELGEIENQLLRSGLVKEAVVVDRVDADGVKYLAAYLVRTGDVSVAELRAFLAKEMPDFMIPSYFIQLQELPLLPNGKVNRRALPAPESMVSRSREYVAPSNPVEERLAEIWSEILRVEKVGVEDNFFELGGHSLKATYLTAKVNKEFKVDLPLRKFFEIPTIAELGRYISGAVTSVYASIKPVEKQEYYSVSSAQKRLFVIDHMEGASTSYNMSGVMTIDGPLVYERLDSAIHGLIERHESLRTSFLLINGEPKQRVWDEVDFAIDYLEAEEGQVAEVIGGFIRPFDLRKAPLLRVGLIRTGTERHYLIFDMHHIISDGISMGILTQEFIQLYEGRELPVLAIQYKDFSAWQNDFFKSEAMAKEEEYWLERFGDELPTLNLPLDSPRPAVKDYAGDSLVKILDAVTLKQLQQFAQAQGVTLYMLLLAVYTAFLSRYSGDEDIVVGTPIAGRPHADLEKIIGMFVNTLAMRNQPGGSKTFVGFLQEVKENVLQAFENQDYQFEMLVEKLQLQRDLSRNPLFDTMFALQNTNRPEIEIADLTFAGYSFESGVTQFDLVVSARESVEGLTLVWEYRTSLFKRETIERMAGHFTNLLNSLMKAPETQLALVQMLTQEEERQLLQDFNANEADYPSGLTIHQLFEEQVAKTPDNLALYYEGVELTYRQLNARANGLAQVLRGKGLRCEELVAVMVKPSLEMIIGILAILKAGGAFFPIDPNYPTERIQFLMTDSRVRFCLTNVAADASISTEMIDLRMAGLYQDTESNLESISTAENLAYVITTSGSTGQPKGVMIEHQALTNMVFWYQQYFKLSATDRTVKYAALTFDASIGEIFPYLTCGAAVYVIPEEMRLDMDALYTYLYRHAITMALFTTSIYEQIAEKGDLPHMRGMLAGGEKIQRVIERNYPFHNVYGPTENTVYATSFAYDQHYDNIPIGKPTTNTEAYVLSRHGGLQPIGVAGELCLGGKGLARGYLYRPELTAEKFVLNPWNPEERLYHTGDLVRWLPDGNLEYMGRIDNQVKVRGYRIELGEIENRLTTHPDIQQAVVVVREDFPGNKTIVAYYVGTAELSVEDLRSWLNQTLPEYMLPAFFIPIAEIPLTSNGKIDRKALPVPEGKMKREYVAPTSEVEATLAGIWAEVIGKPEIGVKDNFFELGGDSIKAIQIQAKSVQRGVQITVKDIFKYKTIADLLANVDYRKPKLIISQDEVDGEVPLTPIQHWFFEQNFTESGYWNQANLFPVRADVDVELLEGVFTKLLVHHDALRMTYELGDGQVRQRNRRVEEVNFQLQRVDLSELTPEIQQSRMEEIALELQSRVSLSESLLVQAVLFDLGTYGKRLFVPVHHLIIDGVSWRILLEDIERLYQSKLMEPLPAKSTSFKEWSDKLTEYARTEWVNTEYWERIDLSKMYFFNTKARITDGEANNLSDLAKDSLQIKSKEIADGEVAAASETHAKRQRHSVTLGASDTELLLTKAHEAFNTEINDLLLTALTLALTELQKSDSIFVNLEGHGREEIVEDVDLSRTVGWFTSIYPIALECKEELSKTIVHVKESLRKVPNHGLDFGIARYLQKRQVLQQLNPEISFNYLGQFDQVLSAEEGALITGLPEEIGPTVHPLNHHPTLLDVTGLIANGALEMTFSYSEDNFDAQWIVGLAEKYIEYLRKTIEHCTETTEQIRTASDFDVEDEFDEDSFELLSDIYDL